MPLLICTFQCPSFSLQPLASASSSTLRSLYLLSSSIPSSSPFLAQQHQQHHRYRPRRLVLDASGTRASHLSTSATLCPSH